MFHSRAGVAVRAGAPKPDISTVEAFKQALLKAKTIGHSLGVSGVHFSTNVVPRLGIAEEIKSRIRISKGFPVGIFLVAKGEAEIGVHQIAELLPIQGIDIVGELPAEIQTTLIYATGVSAGASNRKPPERWQASVFGDVGAGNQEERHGARAAMTRSPSSLLLILPRLLVVATAAMATQPAAAQPAAAPFPTGKPVSMHVGVGPGGGTIRSCGWLHGTSAIICRATRPSLQRIRPARAGGGWRACWPTPHRATARNWE